MSGNTQPFIQAELAKSLFDEPILITRVEPPFTPTPYLKH